MGKEEYEIHLQILLRERNGELSALKASSKDSIVLVLFVCYLYDQ